MAETAPRTGNLIIIESDDEEIDDKHVGPTDNRDSGLPESLHRDRASDEFTSLDTGIDIKPGDSLTDTLCNVPSLINDTSTEYTGHVTNAYIEVQPDEDTSKDKGTVIIEEIGRKISSSETQEVTGLSDELTSLTFGIDAKEESDNSTKQGDKEVEPHSITNILSSVTEQNNTSTESSEPEAQVDDVRLPIDGIIVGKLPTRDKTKRTSKEGVSHGNDRTIHNVHERNEENIDGNQTTRLSGGDADVRNDETTTPLPDTDVDLHTDNIIVVETGLSTSGKHGEGPADVNTDSIVVGGSQTSTHGTSGDDPANQSVRKKLSLFTEKQPKPPPRSWKGPEIARSSVKNRGSFFEEAATRSAEVEVRPKPPRGSTDRILNFQKSLQKAENSSSGGLDLGSQDEVESGTKPKRRISESFRASLKIAEDSSKGKGTESHTVTSGNIVDGDQKPAVRPKAVRNLSFNASRGFVERAESTILGGLKNKRPSQPPVQRDKSPEQRDDRTGETVYKRLSKVTRDSVKTEKDNTMVVAAIDFGTTYSAIAFSFKNDPERIVCKTWEGHVKVPTVILLNPNKEVDSFGHEARRIFAEKLDGKETYKDWFYFDCFKMKIYHKYLDKEVKLEDYSGKEMMAMDVFAKAIGYMRQELLNLLNEERRGVIVHPDSDIHWVLTVPAIWPDMAKTFMREAAKQAMIPTDYLTLALEPEAASLYCRRQMGVNLRGKTYLLLDLGGGTADAVLHEIQPDDSIKERHMASGGDFGGKMVDDEMLKLLTTLYGADVIAEFRRTKHYLDFCNAFELSKRTFDGGKDLKVDIPLELNMMFEEKIGQPIETVLQQSPYKGQISWTRGKTIVSKELMKNIFDRPLKRILETTQHIMDKASPVDHILMVGGFSESNYIDEGIKQRYPAVGVVITAEEPSVAVVMGAVRFGQEPKAIVSRVSKYTYGIGRMMKFKPGDKEKYKIFASGTYWCDNCFNKHIEIGEELSTDEEMEVKAHDYYPPDANCRQFFLEVLASENSNPRYTTDDNCLSIGGLKLEMDPQGDVWSKIEVKLVYKGTELEVQAFDVRNKKLTTGKVGFWG